MLISPDATQEEIERAIKRVRSRPAGLGTVLALPQGRRQRRPRQSPSFTASRRCSSFWSACRRRWSWPSPRLLLSIVVGIPLGLYAGLKPDALSSKAIMAGIDPRVSAADVLGRADADHDVRGDARLAAVDGARRHGDVPRDTIEPLHVGRALRTSVLPALNLALFKISLVIRLTRAGTREAMPAGLHQVRARQGTESAAGSCSCIC